MRLTVSNGLEQRRLPRQSLTSSRNKSQLAYLHQPEATNYQDYVRLKEMGDKLDTGSKSAIEAAVEKVKSKESGDDAAAIDQAVDELNQAMHAFSKQLYERANAAAPGAEGATAGAAAGAKPGQEDVIDAEFEKKE